MIVHNIICMPTDYFLRPLWIFDVKYKSNQLNRSKNGFLDPELVRKVVFLIILVQSTQKLVFQLAVILNFMYIPMVDYVSILLSDQGGPVET